MQVAHLTGIDHVIIWVYVLGMVAMGLWFARRHKTSEDYFVAGRRMSWIPLALSIWASLLSGISLLGAPGYSYKYDLALVLVPCFTIIPIILIVIYLLLPIYHGLSLTTAYTYLERRFGLVLRVIGSGLFIMLRYTWLARMVYASSLALAAVVAIPQQAAALLMGLLATGYTTLGGIMADIWSDVVQSFIMGGALVLIWFYVLRDVGGMGEMWRIGIATGHTYPLSSAGELWSWLTAIPKPAVEIMFLWLILSDPFLRLNDYGTDQLCLQRYFSARSIKQSIRAIVAGAGIALPMIPVLFLTGTGIFVYFHIHGDRFANLPTNPDQMLPYFVAAVLPAGISGLFIAGIFAATMSSVDSAVNCLSAAFITDFYRRLRGPEGSGRTRRIFHVLVAGGLAIIIAVLVAGATAVYIPGLLGGTGQTTGAGSAPTAGGIAILIIIGLVVSLVAGKLILPPLQRWFARLSPETADEAHYLRAARYMSLAWGVVGTITALFLDRLGQIYIQSFILAGFFAGPLMGMFLLGLFTRRATTRGVFIGAIVGFVCCVIWMTLGYTPVMYVVAGTVPTLVVGYLASLFTEPPTAQQLAGMTFFTRSAQKK